jgi:hypothetical protein
MPPTAIRLTSRYRWAISPPISVMKGAAQGRLA